MNGCDFLVLARILYTVFDFEVGKTLVEFTNAANYCEHCDSGESGLNHRRLRSRRLPASSGSVWISEKHSEQ